MKMHLLMKKFLLAACSVGMSSLMAMESINIETTEGNEIVLEEALVAPETMNTIAQSKGKVNKELSNNAWKAAFDIFVLNKFGVANELNELDLAVPENNIFLKHKVETNAAQKFIQLLLILSPKESPLTNETVKAFVVVYLTEDALKRGYNTISGGYDFIHKLDDYLKTTLDKYYYLYFNKHFKLPENLLGYVTVDELLEFNKIDNSKIKKQEYNEINNEMLDNAFEPNNKKEKAEISFDQEVHLNNCYLIALSGWKNLINQKSLIPEQITIINLSNNNIKELPADLLHGFVNLKKFLMAHNKLENIPSNLFYDCTAIQAIDFSHNQLKELPLDITCNKKLSNALIADYNPLLEATQKALTVIRPGHVIKLETKKNKAKDLSGELFMFLVMGTFFTWMAKA